MEKISMQMQTESSRETLKQHKVKKKISRSKTKGELEVLEEVDDESDSALSQKQEAPRKKKREAGVSAGIEINSSSLEKCDGEPVPL